VGIGLLSSLQTLRLADNKLTIFPMQLDMCTALVTLDIAGNAVDEILPSINQLRSRATSSHPLASFAIAQLLSSS
jgi:Leucine-rich repeat (LRR) protein